MPPHPNAMMLLADIRCHDLLDEAVRIRLHREARASGRAPRTATATVRRHMSAAIVRARRHLGTMEWAPTLSRRGAFPS